MTTKICILLFLVSCAGKPEDKSQQTHDVPDKDVALTFVNEYVDFCSTNDPELSAIEWVQNNDLITDEFKSEHKALIENAWLEDEEMGLGFDPILNAQDYPDDGFVFSNFDSNGNLILKGEPDPQFKVIVRMKLFDDKWRVDGAGVVNMPGSNSK